MAYILLNIFFNMFFLYNSWMINIIRYSAQIKFKINMFNLNYLNDQDDTLLSLQVLNHCVLNNQCVVLYSLAQTNIFFNYFYILISLDK